MTTEWYCGEHDVQEPLHYNWCGLDDVYLLSGFTRTRDDDGEESISIKNMDGLHRAIGEHLAKHKKALNGNEIRFLRKQMGISQDELAEILNVADQTVARWEKGEFEIPGPAELLVRLVFLSDILPHINPKELAAKLREVDSAPKEKQVFQPIGDSWQALAA
jgi:DNA-binding transcriptional regulator YiaG